MFYRRLVGIQPDSPEYRHDNLAKAAELSIRINGVDYYPKGIDFTSAASMDGVAAIMQSAINAEYQSATGISNALSVKWDAYNRFVFDYVATPWVRLGKHKSSSVTFYPAASDTGTEVSGPAYLDGANGHEPNPTQYNHNIYIPSESVLMGSPNGGVTLIGCPGESEDMLIASYECNESLTPSLVTLLSCILST